MSDATTGSSALGLLFVVLVIVAVAGLALWMILRRGSIADRAEVDVPIDDDRGPGDHDGGDGGGGGGSGQPDQRDCRGG